MLHDAFICHASEDKEKFVEPLATALQAHNLEIWFDEFSLIVGDSIRQSIDRGLANSRFGVVVLSPTFFEKQWTNWELNGLVGRQNSEGEQVILPIWHNVDDKQVRAYSPSLADIIGVPSSKGIDFVVSELLKKIRPEPSPLVVARDFLIEKGWSSINEGRPPPIVSDEWWLHVAGIKDGEFHSPDPNKGWRWIFPLPYGETTGRELGLNIGWTALQVEWSSFAEENKICQLTHPDRVHSFLRDWPGLMECANSNPGTLLIYAPQLSIPGFDEGFEEKFDELLTPDHPDAQAPMYYSKPSTIDGADPLCGELIAWRHPQYGNYTPGDLGYAFVNAHNSYFSRTVFGGFECTVWLLSSASGWMPERLRDTLIAGMKERTRWWLTDTLMWDNAFCEALHTKSRSEFEFTSRVKSALEELVENSLAQLGIADSKSVVSDKFIESEFDTAFYDEWERITSTARGVNPQTLV